MSVIYGSSFNRIARKQHRCEECGHKIEIGTKYYTWEGATDDSDGPYTWKSHLDCHQAALLMDKVSGWDEDDGSIAKIVDVISEYPELKSILRRAYPTVALRFKRNNDAAEARYRARMAESRARMEAS